MGQYRSSRTRQAPSPLMLSLIATGVVLFFLALGWFVLHQLPSRYLARLPHSLQNLVISAPESAVLPTLSAPSDQSSQAEALLQPTGIELPQLPPDKTLAPTPTLAPNATLVPTPLPTSTTPPNATPTPTLVPIPLSARLSLPVRHEIQGWNNCGPATLAMGLSAMGLGDDQNVTASYLKPNPEDRNVSPAQMAAYVNEKTMFRAVDRIDGSLQLLKTLIAKDFPVIIEIGLDPPSTVAWLEWYGHYLLVGGYDDNLQQLWVYDSLIWDDPELAKLNSPEGRAYLYTDLYTYWPHFNRSYVVLYPPEREGELAELIGSDWDTVGMWQKSLINAQTVLKNQPENAFSWFNLGSSFNALGQHGEAAVAFDQALNIGLPWRMLWYQFGPYEAYYNIGRYDDVIQLANQTLSDRPYFEESLFWRGMAYQAKGEKELARADFRTSADFNPNYQPAQTALNAINN